MTPLEDVTLPRVVLLADASGVDEGGAASAFVSALGGRRDVASAISLTDGQAPVARRALAALEDADELLLLTAPGLLTPLDARGGTLADAGTALRYKGVSAGVALVTTAGVAGRHHVLALHREVLAGRDLPLLGALQVSAGPQPLSWVPPEAWGTMAA